MTASDWRARFPRRSIHLDFHTGPDVPDVGAGFDPDAFARTFADAQVDSVTVFAKCHHGHLYYDTDRPERHPSLPRGLDLLGQQIEALHGARIRAPIYLSVQCDEHAADRHQDWVALAPDLAQVRRPSGGAFEAAWQILDMSSPYQDYLAEQLAEVLDRFAPVDGIFLDMCWDQPSVSRWAIEGMSRERLDPADPGDRSRYARLVADGYMARFSEMVEPALYPGSPTGAWFNSRPKAEIALDHRHLRHVEVEALPTGGWGHSYLPYVGRLARSSGLPVLGMTGRFHRSWGDSASLKPAAALKHECCQVLMHGLANSVGDLLPPSGIPSTPVYERIGAVYGHVAACEPYVAGGRQVTEVALVVDPAEGDQPGAGVVGAVRALQRLRQQFDVVPLDASFEAYSLVVVPEGVPVDTVLAGRLEGYLDAGGSLLLGMAGSSAPVAGLLDRRGVSAEGSWPFDPVFLGLSRPSLLDPSPGLDIRVPGESAKVSTRGEAEVLVEVVLPFFQRSFAHFSGHSYTPASPGPSGHGAVVQSGRVIVLAVPLLSAVAGEGNPEYLEVLGACIDRLLPRPLLRAGGPVHLETAVVATPGRTAVHLLSFLPSRAAGDLDLVFDPFPLASIEVSLRRAAPPTGVTLQPEDRALELSYADGYATVHLDVPDGHALVVFEG